MVCSSIGRWRVLAAFILWLTPVVAFAESVTVEWDPSEGATGYTVRWGTALGSYPNTADAGPSTQFTIAGLVPGTMYWAVAQAYNATEVSEYSSPLQFTVPGGTLPCSYSISPAGTSISAVGVSGAIVVATQAGCSWSATSSSGFLTFQNGAGRTGSGSVTFAVSANTASSARTGTAIVAGKGFTVSQAAAAPQSCSYSISPANTSAPAAPSAGMIATPDEVPHSKV